MILRNIRVALATFFIISLTLLFLDFSGTLYPWVGWMAKIQFLPAVMALNIIVIIGLIVLTLVFGRVYCSVICPLGVMQDIFGRLGRLRKKNRYSFSRAKSVLRYTVLAIVVVSAVVGLGWIVALVAPYSAYGRIVHNLLSPAWIWVNNELATWAEEHDSYAFYHVDMLMPLGVTFFVAAATLTCLAVLAWRNGRTYCNTICPVGTLLGFLSKYSLLRPVIYTSRCNSCGLCARNCKAACIDSKAHEIDYSRCVACMDCIGKCHKGAISYTSRRQPKIVGMVPEVDSSRRGFLTAAAVIATSTAVKAAEKTVDGGLAVIEDKKVPVRETPVVPPGALSLKNFTSHCTACQLCVSVCPNGVLRPSSNLATLMQPESSYELGFCRPECVKCSEVCPSGAIVKVDTSVKASTQIGHAVWISDNCIPLRDGVECGNCARHCPVGAIQMVAFDIDDPGSPKVPVVSEERCIGCGACEYLCPSRPLSAIYVEGHKVHRSV